MTRTACLDIGSTWTKGVLVDRETGAVLGSAQASTTVATDVLDGVESVLDRLGPSETVLACSSAGGGLRLAVVGYERAVTAEAGARVALSAGARVVCVSAGPLTRAGVGDVLAARPDVVLLVGGTDGGNADVLLHNAVALAAARPSRRSSGRDTPWTSGRPRRVATSPAGGADLPVVVAGNAAAAEEALRVLGDAGASAEATANVLPRIGELDPEPARAAIREAFLRHVIGGTRLTRRPAELAALVRAPTPDAVRAGVEVLAEVVGADVLVVDVGGATTDVCSVIDVERVDADERGDVAGVPVALRTVEGDLGVRASAPGVVEAAVAERLLVEATASALSRAAARRHDDPAWLPASAQEQAEDVELARLAVTVALRRHGRTGRDLRRVALVVGSGGVLRAAPADACAAVLGAATSDLAGGWRLPERARLVTDEQHVLAAAGLLAAEHADAARALVATLADDLGAAAPQRISRPAVPPGTGRPGRARGDRRT